MKVHPEEETVPPSNGDGHAMTSTERLTSGALFRQDVANEEVSAAKHNPQLDIDEKASGSSGSHLLDYTSYELPETVLFPHISMV